MIVITNRWPPGNRLVIWAFCWEDRKGREQAAIALGNGSLYSHSFYPNLSWRRAYIGQTITFRALRAITFREELTINYNGRANDMTPMDFKVT